jgi:hypothetical protein
VTQTIANRERRKAVSQFHKVTRRINEIRDDLSRPDCTLDHFLRMEDNLRYLKEVRAQLKEDWQI